MSDSNVAVDSVVVPGIVDPIGDEVVTSVTTTVDDTVVSTPVVRPAKSKAKAKKVVKKGKAKSNTKANTKVKPKAKAKTKVVAKAVVKASKSGKRGRGRPPVYSGESLSSIVKLLKKLGNVSHTRNVLNAKGAGKANAALIAQRKEVGLTDALGISMPTLLVIAKRAGIQVSRGRPTAA
jgi:hypothetical protein